MRREGVHTRGAAALLVLGVMAVMLLVGAMGVNLFMGGLKITAQDTLSKRALFCAEAGLAAGKAFFGQNFTLWDRYLACNLDGNCAALDYPLVRYAEPAAQRLRPTRRQPLDAPGDPGPGSLTRQPLPLGLERQSVVEVELPPVVLGRRVDIEAATAHHGPVLLHDVVAEAVLAPVPDHLVELLPRSLVGGRHRVRGVGIRARVTMQPDPHRTVGVRRLPKQQPRGHDVGGGRHTGFGAGRTLLAARPGAWSRT